METHPANSLGIVLIICRKHPALTCRDGLGRIKTKRCKLRYRADPFPSVLSRQGMGCVFDYMAPIFPGERVNAIKIARLPGDVYGNNGLCT